MIFTFLDHSDLDLWPTDPKSISDLLLPLINHPMKLEDCGWKGTQVIIFRWFSYFRPQWPWPLTYWPQKHQHWQIILWSLKILGKKELKGTLVIILRWFSHFRPQWPWPLTYWSQKHRNHLLTLTNHPVKFEESGLKGTLVII